MARIVDRVKDTVRRSNSLHRRSGSLSKGSEGRRSEDNTPPLPQNNGLTLVEQSGPFSSYRPVDDHTPRLPQSIPAWHVHKASNSNTSRPVTSDASATQQQRDITNRPVAHDVNTHIPPSDPTTQPIPARSSSLRNGKRSSTSAHQTAPPLERIDSATLPGLPMSEVGYSSRPMTQASYGGDHDDYDLSRRTQGMSLDDTRANGRLPDHANNAHPTTAVRNEEHHHHHQQQHERSIPPHIPNGRAQTSEARAHRQSNTAADRTQNLTLPEGFNMNSTEETTVDTVWRPAVTREVVHHETTEILREEITRDIHVHHYYTYEQPIKVVEVLPAKHYHLDTVTGIKTEIRAPLGWMMPDDMQIRQPDLSQVKAVTRHYLVNEQYPNGIMEPPPRSLKRDSVDGSVHRSAI